MRGPASLALLLVLAALAGPASGAGWWQPTSAQNFQFNYQLGTMFNPSKHFINGVQVYFLDGEGTPKEAVDAIKARGGFAVCYFSAGSFEDWRSDASSFPASVLGKGLDGWPGEKWLDVRQLSVLKPIMANRMKEWCQAKGFDAVDPDNVDGYSQDSGFQIAGADQIAYNKMIADVAHGLGLGAGLKNDLDQIPELEPSFDFFVNEQCYAYNECDRYSPAKNANKPVFNVEYKSGPFGKGCRCESFFGLTTILKPLSLPPKRTACSRRSRNRRCPYS